MRRLCNSILCVLPIWMRLIGTSKIWIQWIPLILIKLLEISLHFPVHVFKDFMKSILALECFGKDDISMKSCQSHKCRQGPHSLSFKSSCPLQSKECSLFWAYFTEGFKANWAPANQAPRLQPGKLGPSLSGSQFAVSPANLAQANWAPDILAPGKLDPWKIWVGQAPDKCNIPQSCARRAHRHPPIYIYSLKYMNTTDIISPMYVFVLEIYCQWLKLYLWFIIFVYF